MLFRPSAEPSSYVTFCLLGYDTLRAKNWAFWQMAPAPPRLARVEGVTFSKLLGCGAGNGFSLRPDLGTYAWVACWRDADSADRFFGSHPWWAKVQRLGREQLKLTLTPTLAHGLWNKRQPFLPAANYEREEPLAVLTRATVRPSRMIEFRRHVGPVSARVSANPNCLLSVGIGEYPLFMQATLSLWRSGKAMEEFAYGGATHQRTMRRTRQRDWYREELFARMRIDAIAGSWRGKQFSSLLADGETAQHSHIKH